MNTLVRKATVITCEDGDPVVRADHDIIISDHVIEAVQPAGAADARKFERVIEADRHLVIPGLINTHHHLYQTLTRGLRVVQNAPLFQWLTELYKRWQHVDYEAVKVAAQVSIGELLLSGCTTTSDHFYLFPQGTDVRLEAVLEAAESLGIRIHACRGSMTLGQSKGGLPPDHCTEDDEAVLRDCQRALEEFHDPDAYALRRIDLAPCSPFNVSTDLFRETASLARDRGALLHTHAAETADEQDYCVERFGCRPIRYLQDHGFLGDDVYLAHCVFLNDEEVELLIRSRTGVAHCPCSNMRLGSGVPRIRELLRGGGKVGLGVDGSSSNDGGHALAEARQALLLQRVVGGPEALHVSEAFRMATVGGAQCLGRRRLGRIVPGGAADLAFYRADDIAFAGAVAQDPLGALMLCHAPRADRVMVHGRLVVDGGRLTRIDETRLAEQLNGIVRARFSR